MTRQFSDFIREQAETAGKAILRDGFRTPIRTIAGFDQTFTGDSVVSAAVVCDYADMDVLERTHSVVKTQTPYIPGYLYFREGPAVLEAHRKLKTKPDVLLIDGQGVCHPRGAGIAMHVGVNLSKPAIGVAKSRLCGDYEEPCEKPSKITLDGKQVGWALKSRPGCNPILISPGNLVSVNSSLGIVKQCLRNHKLPEPLRLAHAHCSEIRRRLE